MKKIILLLYICVFSFLGACAQQKEYISYTVQEGESLKDIAKKFDVKSKTLSKLNPGISKRPNPNTVLLVPNVNYDENEVVVKASKTYIVQPKETLYGISKKFEVSIDSLKKENPQIDVEGLKIGMVLTIPDEKEVSKEELQQQYLDSITHRYLIHTVVKGDTYYSLTKRYEITKEELNSNNPELSEGLKLGMVLKIREKDLFDINENLFLKDTLSSSIVFRDTIADNKELNVAMLLPFKFSKNDTLSKEQLFSAKNNLINIVSDYYLGAQIAIDSLRTQGLKINVSAYDTENNRDTIQQILKDSSFNNIDVVFGPVYNSHVEYVANQLGDISVVYPFYSSKQGNFISKNIIKTAPSRDLFEEKVLKYIKEKYCFEQIVIVGEEDEASRIKISRIAKELNLLDSLNEVKILQPKNGYIDREKFVSVVDTLNVNWIVMATNSNVVTSDVVNNIKSLSDDVPGVRMFAFEKGKNFSSTANNNLARLNVTYASSGVFNDTLPKVHSFYEKYEKINKTYPTPYAIRGFDITYDILMRMASTEEGVLDSTLNKGISTRIQDSYNYDQEKGPVFNKSVFLLKYNDDLTLEVLKND